MSKGNKTGKNTYLRGNTEQVTVPVDTEKTNEADEIAIGDMVYLNRALRTASANRYKARPMSHLVAASIDDRGAHFLGVSMDQSKDGDSDEILVYTNGVFEFDLDSSSTVYVGEPAQLQVAGEGDGSTSLDCFHTLPTVTIPTGAGRVIGTVVKYGTSQTTAEVAIHSNIMHGSYDSNYYGDTG